SRITASSNGAESTLAFYHNVLSGKGTAVEGTDISPACRSCGHPVAPNADITIGLFGTNMEESLLFLSNTEKGDQVLQVLGLSEKADEPAGRQSAVSALVNERVTYRDRMF